jgi:hypothetical protein
MVIKMNAKLLLVLFIAGSIIHNPLFAQFIQQSLKLVGTGAVGKSYQGTSVAISGDGNTVIVGGPHDNSDTGAVWIFTQSTGVWTQQGSKLLGTGALGIASYGYAVALSADGNIAIVGGGADDGNKGAIWVFTRSGGVWIQQGSKLIGTGAVGNSWQGSSVAVSADGNTVIEGGYEDNSFQGAVWIFTRNGGVWTQQGPKLVGTGVIGYTSQGHSVAISSDGNTVIESGDVDNNFIGAVWVFTRSGGVWTQQGPKKVGSGFIGLTYEGSSVAISSDGNTAIVGGGGDNNRIGATWVFTRSGSVWTQQGSKLVGSGVVGIAAQGTAAVVSSDGNTAFVGGTNDNSSAGAVWVFVNPPTGITPISGEGPGDFNLSQNYPNPFNPTTTINYSIGKEGHAKITVYNIMGSKIAVIVDENKSPGSYSVQFNAGALPSGIYFYKLE